MGHSPASGKARCTASARSPARRAFRSAVEGVKAASKTPHYTGPPPSNLLGIHVERPADAPLPAGDELGPPLAEKGLERRAGPGAHQELRALEPGSPLQ